MTTTKHGAKAYLNDSAATLLRAIAVALSVFLTIPFLVRSLPAASYSAWVLALSIASYVGVAESGASTAIVRFSASEENEPSELIASALLTVTLLGLVPLSVIGILATTSNFFFSKAPPALYPKIRLAILLCCINAFLTLWASVISGYFTARHRVKVSALVSTVVLTLGSLAMVGSVLNQHSLVLLAAIFAAMGVFNVGGMLLAISPAISVLRVMPWRATRSTSKKIAVHCLATGWWNLAMLLISGLDLFLVSRIDFGAVGAYGIALKLLSLLFVVLSAGLTPVMAIAARAHARDDVAGVTKLFMQSTQAANSGTAFVGGMLFASAPLLVRAFAGESYVSKTTLILRVLIVANLIRNTGAALGVVMVATGEHRKAYLPPAAEALANFSFSILLGSLYGAVGIAYGTVIGALTTLILYVAVIFPRFTAFRPNRGEFLKEGVLKPAAIFVPFALVGAINIGHTVSISLATLGAAMVSVAVTTFTLKADEKQSLLRLARLVVGRVQRKGRRAV